MPSELWVAVGTATTALSGGFAAWVTAQKSKDSAQDSVAVDLVRELRGEVEALRQDVDELRTGLDAARQAANHAQTELSLYILWCQSGHQGVSPLDPAFIRPGRGTTSTAS